MRMRYKLFGRSGLRVSELSLGTMNFGTDHGWGIDRDASQAVFDAYAEAGGNFIDTAYHYTDGSSERMVGDFIHADRDNFVVATKYTGSLGQGLARHGNSRKAMMRMVEESLRRLRIDCIDLYHIHFWDYTTPIDEVMRGLDDLVRAGKVLYIVASDLPAWEVSRANMLAYLRGWTPFVGIQVEYSLVERTPERELLPMAKTLDLGITAWSPLAGGALVAKQGMRARRHASPRVDAIADVVQAVAAELGRTAGQVALAAVRQQTRFGSIIPIVGASSAAQMKDSLGCLDLTLAPEHIERLDAASRIRLGFPHELLRSPYMRSASHGGEYERLDNHRAIPD